MTWEKALRGISTGIYCYEITAINVEALPTISVLARRNPLLGAVIVGGLYLDFAGGLPAIARRR